MYCFCSYKKIGQKRFHVINRLKDLHVHWYRQWLCIKMIGWYK